MIVIDHSKGYPNVYSLVNGRKRAVFDDVYYYKGGYDPPHYQVPATRSNAITATSYVCGATLLCECELTPLLI